jgi:hypothetical protein
MLQPSSTPCFDFYSTSSIVSTTGDSEPDTVQSLNTQQSRVRACDVTSAELHIDASVESFRPARLIATLPLDVSRFDGVVDTVRSDDPLRQPVDPGWLVGACRASLQECEAVVVLAARQIAADDEFSTEYVRLKHLAARMVMLIPASMNQVARQTSLRHEIWTVTAKACAALFAEADNFPFDGWVTKAADGCRQLADVLRRAAAAGVESPLVRV